MDHYAVQYGYPLPRVTRVWTAETGAIKRGYAFCYNSDYAGVALTLADPKRLYHVEKPSTTNHMWFAGVAARDYTADASGQYIDIVPPGNWCYVYGYVSFTAGATYASAECAQWYFRNEGLPGCGRFKALQTVDRSSTAGECFGYLEDGVQSGLTARCLPVTGDAMTGVITHGVNYFAAITLAGNSTYTLADGTHLDQEVAIFALGTVTTSDVVITVTSPAVPTVVTAGPLAVTAYGTFTIDAATEYLRAKWDGKAWVCTGIVSST